VNIEKMKEFINLKNEITADAAIGFDFHNNKIHVKHEDLMGFENLQVKYRGDGNYPFEISAKLDGFEIYAIVKAESINDFPQFKDFAKTLLLKQLEAIENGKEVTA
jgi:hypothetical protein